MVEQEGYDFPVAIEYEGLADFCTHCKIIGHNITSCRWLHPRSTLEQLVDKGKEPLHSQKTKQGWKSKDNPNRIGSSKAFATVTPIQHNDTIHATTILAGATAVPIQQDHSRVEPSRSAPSHHDDRDDLCNTPISRLKNFVK